jgi:hypothetical protein
MLTAGTKEAELLVIPVVTGQVADVVMSLLVAMGGLWQA